MRRRRRPWILLPLPLLLLTACSPVDEPIVALAVQDGQPVGVLVTCEDRDARLAVFENDHQGDPGKRTLIRWSINGPPASEIVEVTLLGQPPEGWEVADAVDTPAAEADIDPDVEPLTEFRPGVTYTVTGSSRRNAISVDFTLADLPRIGPDQVLAPRGHDSTRVVSRETFLRKARDKC
ncbi:hypothetical protein PSH03_001469 [Micromonospora sp. PSH03]|uniref:hypothetical protein n=1 Tax=Micromonospora TaxID=1873 RepID=UPI001B388020|nr:MULTISPECIES: hypothetical protein [Micromonospora]MBQ0989249.1 hypothetical protein [Micromonospora sp. H61]MCG5456568.1 hypothetical protein [Micromonospora salmantinae]